MAIHVTLDRMLERRGITLTELSERVGMTLANLSILKTGKARAIRFSTVEALCRKLTVSRATFSRTTSATEQATRPINAEAIRGSLHFSSSIRAIPSGTAPATHEVQCRMQIR